MKELEIVSHFKASFFKKNLRSRIFSYFREKNNFNTRLYEKVIYHYYVLLDGFLPDRCTASQVRILFHRRRNGSQSSTRHRIT